MKRNLLLCMIIIVLLSTVSCKSDNRNNSLKSGSSKELTMYIMDYDTAAKNAVENFNKVHKYVQIKTKSIIQIPVDNLGSKLMYELNSGEGPDIILCEQSTLPNLSVFFNKGSFYDLNILINNDKAFKKTDYFEKVLEYGLYKEKRYILPLSFKINSLYTTKDILSSSGQGISNTGTGIDELIGASKKHIAADTEKDKYFITNVDFASLLQTSAKPFYNLEKKTAEFNSQEFGELMDKYKSLSESVWPEGMTVSPAEINNFLSNDKAVFANINTMGPRYVAEPYGSFKSEVDPVIIPSPYADSARHVIAKPERYIGINSKCGNIEAAYDFIKLMLSEEYQDIDIMEGIPVNRKAYEQEKSNCLKEIAGYDMWKKGGCKNSATLKKLYSQLDTLIGGIDRCWTTDDYVLTIVQNEVSNYLKSNATREDTLNTIQKKVEGYLNSGFMVTSNNIEDDTTTDPAKTVSLYYWNIPCYVENAEYLFKQKYPDLNIKRKTFTSISEFYKSTAIEIMAGGGPDIVIFDPRYFNSMEKTIRTGVFCEMDDYIKKYEILNKDYNKNLLKGGVYNGKRYFLPLYYINDSFCTTKQILENNKIEINEKDWTWNTFASYAVDFLDRNKGKNKYFLNSGFDFSYMIKSCEIPLIDYVKNKSNFDSDAFRQLLKLYKKIYPAVDPQSDKFSNLLKNEKDVFIAKDSLGEAETLKFNYEDITSYTKGEMAVVPIPTLTGVKKEYVVLADCIAVNSRCKNKDIAFKFIQIAASYDMQRDRDSRGKKNGIFAAPINDKAFKDDILSYPIAKDLPQLVDRVISVRKNFEECSIKEYNIRQMANDLANEYAKGNKSIDQVVKEMDEKVTLYLNE